MKRLTVIAIALALSSGCAGRYYPHAHTHYGYAAYPTAPAQIVVTQPPPPVPLTVELRPPQPSASSAWIEGHWTYNGMWVWVDGTWVSGYSGWLWTAPAIVIVDGYYVLHRGYFRQPRYQPAPAYINPGRITISVGAQVAANPRYQSGGQPSAQPDPSQAPVDQPRVLEVPGAIVRTPPAPTVTATPGLVLSTPREVGHGPSDQRSVLVAPGATVIARPIDPQPASPAASQPTAPSGPVTAPPPMSNVAPVIERPTPQRPLPPQVATPEKIPGRISTPVPVPEPQPAPQPVVVAPQPAVVAPSKPSDPPARVAPSGNATLGPRRANSGQGQQQAAEQPAPQRPSNLDAMRSQAERQRDDDRARNAAQTAPGRPSPPPAAATPSSIGQARGKPAPAAHVLPSGGATRSAGRGRKDPEPTPTKKPTAVISCSLIASEAPRGGQLDLHGEGFGATLVVRIGGKVARILRRNATDIRVQIPRDSAGGSVTVHAGATTGECGSLTIIGTDR